MRSPEEIAAMIEKFSVDVPAAKKAKQAAVLDVLKNDLDSDDIERKYFDENDPWVEQAAARAREWLDGECEDTELHI